MLSDYQYYQQTIASLSVGRLAISLIPSGHRTYSARECWADVSVVKCKCCSYPQTHSSVARSYRVNPYLDRSPPAAIWSSTRGGMSCLTNLQVPLAPPFVHWSGTKALLPQPWVPPQDGMRPNHHLPIDDRAHSLAYVPQRECSTISILFAASLFLVCFLSHSRKCFQPPQLLTPNALNLWSNLPLG